MGIFNSFSKEFNESRERALSSIKLVEPSTGRILELQVTEQNEAVEKMYMSQLELYAESLQRWGVKWEIKGKKICLTFPDGDMAEKQREMWKK